MLYATSALIAACAVLTGIEAFPSGAPAGACSSMMPNHGAAAQPGAGPFQVTHNMPATLVRDVQYHFTVSSTDGTELRGIFCQVRNANDSADTRPYGMFMATTLTKTVDCSATFPGVGVYSALTHTSQINAANVSGYFILPAAEQAPELLNLFCTVVQTRPTFYVRIPSNSAFYSGAAVATTQATAATTAIPYTSAMPTMPTTGNCPAAESATTDEERYRAYLNCWSTSFASWYSAYQNWLNNGGRGCA